MRKTKRRVSPFAGILSRIFGGYHNVSSGKIPTQAEFRQAEENRKARIIEIKLADGLKEFTYPDGFKTIALNKSNADRKHANHLKALKA